MAEINTGGGDGKKGKPKKQQLRVDFTPMVDMNMLLITFFMFCTTLAKPQTMDIVLPAKDNELLTDDDRSKVKESTAITLILGEDDKIYYYLGKPNYEDYTSLHVTDYQPDGLRALLLEKNEDIVKQITDLKKERFKKNITEEEYKEKAAEVKKDQDAQVVIIKPTDAASYKNLVDVLDEMQISSIARYAVVDMTDGDFFLVQNLNEKGALSAQAPKK